MLNFLDVMTMINQTPINIDNTAFNKQDLDIPQYIPSLPKSTKHFSASFSFDALKILANIRSAPSLMSFKSRLKAYPIGKA